MYIYKYAFIYDLEFVLNLAEDTNKLPKITLK